MQNKGNCGCQNTGFVPVSGNWDFNTLDECGCQQCYTRRISRRSSCQQCGGNENTRENDCQCERCNDSRTADCCGQNTWIRDLDDCECSESACGRVRNGKACSECGGDSGHNGHCGCAQDNGGAYGSSRKNRGVGMIKAAMQEIDELYESERALRAGTIFPELHKPLNGYCPCDGNCGTCAQAAAFAAWELRLYLNTHPDDAEALKLFRKLCREAEDVNYATTFLKDADCTSGWRWVTNPWPWEYDCQCGDRKQGCDCRSGTDCRSGCDHRSGTDCRSGSDSRCGN